MSGPGDGCPGGDKDFLDCREVFLRIDDYMDRALTSVELERVHAHLEVCAPCAQELGFSGAMIEEIKVKLRRIRAPEALRARIAEMFAAER